MRRETRLGKLLTRLKAGIVADVPPSIDACEACREVDCTEERWRICPARLELEAERLKELAAKAAPAPSLEAFDQATPRTVPAKLDKKNQSKRPGRKRVFSF
jgi:hypothetical protein